MKELSADELRNALDDCVLAFGDDWDVLKLSTYAGEHVDESVACFSLSTMVNEMLDVMSTAQERDEMLELARHFDRLSKRIRKTISDSEVS